MSYVDETEDEENQRTNPVGLYHYAVSYDRAAVMLREANLRTTHKEAPIYFLHYHAIELYLKAYLRLKGLTVQTLASRSYGHRLCCLSDKATQLGFDLMDEDKQVLSIIANTDVVIRSRYIRTGYFRAPTLEALERTCTSLREYVRQAIRDTGTFVR